MATSQPKRHTVLRTEEKGLTTDLFQGGALDSQVSDSQYINHLTGSGDEGLGGCEAGTIYTGMEDTELMKGDMKLADIFYSEDVEATLVENGGSPAENYQDSSEGWGNRAVSSPIWEPEGAITAEAFCEHRVADSGATSLSLGGIGRIVYQKRTHSCRLDGKWFSCEGRTDVWRRGMQILLQLLSSMDWLYRCLQITEHEHQDTSVLSNQRDICWILSEASRGKSDGRRLAVAESLKRYCGMSGDRATNSVNNLKFSGLSCRTISPTSCASPHGLFLVAFASCEQVVASAGFAEANQPPAQTRSNGAITVRASCLQERHEKSLKESYIAHLMPLLELSTACFEWLTQFYSKNAAGK
ncbi:hypothetical protein BKA93DRAFT_748209 [Sparassis latifolia]